jgi:hypothetical protein
MFEIAVMATVEIHDNRHDLTEGQWTLAVAVPLTVLEQTAHIEGLVG